MGQFAKPYQGLCTRKESYYGLLVLYPGCPAITIRTNFKQESISGLTVGIFFDILPPKVLGEIESMMPIISKKTRTRFRRRCRRRNAGAFLGWT